MSVASGRVPGRSCDELLAGADVERNGGRLVVLVRAVAAVGDEHEGRDGDDTPAGSATHRPEPRRSVPWLVTPSTRPVSKSGEHGANDPHYFPLRC